MDDHDLALTDLAEQQHGLIADRQVRALGLTRSAWRHRVDRGDWTRLTERVVRRRGAPPSDGQRALAGVLDVGPSAVVAHESGAALWGVPGCRLDPLEVISLRGRRLASPLATVHRPRHLPDPFAVVLDGVPVVRPAVVLLQIAPRVHPVRLQRMLDWFWNRRLLSGPSMRRELEPLMHRGRAGTTAIRELLDGLPADYVPPASALEARFAQILAEAGLPPMRRQVDLGDDGVWCGRVDFLGLDVPLVVEVDGEAWHTALTDVASDAVRQAQLDGAGFVVVRVSQVEVWHHKDVVVERIRRARQDLRTAA